MQWVAEEALVYFTISVPGSNPDLRATCLCLGLCLNESQGLSHRESQRAREFQRVRESQSPRITETQKVMGSQNLRDPEGQGVGESHE